MKTLVILCVSVLSVAAFANDNYVINLDWSKASTLSDNVVQQCDDTNIPAVDIVIPGKGYRDFSIEFGVDISEGRVNEPGCSVKAKVGTSSTTYTFDAVGGGCTIRVFQLRPARGQKPKSAVYELSDAC